MIPLIIIAALTVAGIIGLVWYWDRIHKPDGR